jgi:membrane protease YdiL (CAAX protease family)
LGLLAVVLVGGAYLFFGACRIAIHPDSWRLWRTVIGFVPAALLIAVLEEVIFRGYVVYQLMAYSTPLAILGSSLSYALVHLRGSLVWPATAFELIGLWILGVILALSRLRTGQLYVAIGLHASLAYCARVNKLLVEFPDSTIAWLVGTNRLVNGVVTWLVLIAIGWIITRRAAHPSEGGAA